MNIVNILFNHPRWGEIRIDFNDEDEFGTILLYPGQVEDYKEWVRGHTTEISDLVRHPVGWEVVEAK